jgi:cytochrome c
MKKRLLLIGLALLGQPLLAMAGGDAVRGQALFKPCASCHQIGPYASAGYGPQLNAIIGRKAAITMDFKYSEAMKKSGIVWNEQNLAAFLRAPDALVPGTKMRFWGIKDEQQIADLLAYLRSVR